MKKYLLDFLKDNKIDIINQKIVLAVSTGIDSMALLHSFLEIKEEMKLELIVCHVNHNRREQSKIEEEYIKEFCLEKNIKCYVRNLVFDSIDNFQAQARNKRYEFFYEVMEKERASFLVLAHHGDDLVETVLMRILRGSSLEGYGAMKKVSHFRNYIIIRPFLDLERKDIEKYQEDKSFIYYEDESNSHLDYTRNKIRHLVLPHIKEIDRDCVKKFLEFSNVLNGASKEVDKVRDEFILKNVIRDNNGFYFEKDKFLLLSSYMQNEVLFCLLKEHSFSKKNILEFVKWINSEKKNYKNSYKNVVFLKEYNKISFLKKIDEPLDIDIEITELGKYKINDTISINVVGKCNNLVTNLNELCYNIEELPIRIRTRRIGDKICIGNNQTKKVKDLLIDEKIALSRRESTLLAVDKNNNVLIVFGVKKSSKLIPIDDCNIIIRVEENYA